MKVRVTAKVDRNRVWSVRVDGRSERKKKNLGSEYYNLTDPLIDESELAVDEHAHVHRADEAT